MKKHTILFWIFTSLIFLTQGVGTAVMLIKNSPESAKGMADLGYPAYFGFYLSLFKIAGAIALMLPMLPARLREWAYAGFFFDFAFAFFSLYEIKADASHLAMPIVFVAILATSYMFNYKMRGENWNWFSK